MKLSYDLYSPPGDREVNLPPVILLHGMLDSKKTWKFLAPQIAHNTGRKVFALDARNHGQSPWSDDFTFDILADDVDNFLTDHRIPKATVLGHSMGGRTALTLALKRPDKVEKLVVEDMVLKNFRPNQSGLIVEIIQLMKESLQHIPLGVDQDTAKKAIAKYMKDFIPPNPHSAGNKSTNQFDLSMIPLKQEGDTFAWQANLDVIGDMLSTDKIRQNLSGVYHGDALFLYGTNSFFNVEKDAQIPQFFPRALKVAVEKATHLVHFEFQKRFVEEVSFFINGNIHHRSKY